MADSENFEFPEDKVDFDKPVWLVEAYYSSDVKAFAVNADTKEEAAQKIYPTLSLIGLERIEVARMEFPDRPVTDGT